MASTYVAGGDLEYGRYGNPTWSAFEEALGALEGGRCLAFASGLATVSTVLDLVGLGAAVVAPRHAYNGTVMQLADLEARGRLTARLVDITDTDAVVEGLRRRGPGVARVADQPGPRDRRRSRPSRRPRTTPAPTSSSTTRSPLRCGSARSTIGADLVVHSATKYLSGHSDAMLGAVVTTDDQLYDVLKGRRDLVGAIPGTFEAWLALRGLRTLHLRVERAESNATELARRLGEHPAVAEVRYPGFGGIVSDRPRRRRRRRRPRHPLDRRCGCTRPGSAGSSRRSSDGAGGRPSPPRSPRAWSGSASASRTSRTSGPTSIAGAGPAA